MGVPTPTSWRIRRARLKAAGMNVDALERVAAPAQMPPPHAAGLELMSERPFKAFAALALHPLAAIPPDPPTVRVHDGRCRSFLPFQRRRPRSGSAT